ncbi:MAG TPA: glycogen-binding domain-containing protein [Gemmatimonadales bacterium]
MEDRIQRALDGELPAESLAPHERAELQQYRAIIGTALGPIRRVPAINVVPEVMRRVAPRSNRLLHALGAAVRWLWSPRALTLRPAYGLAGALAVAAVISASLSQPATPDRARPARMMVQFRLGDAQAHEVALAGDFNGWQPNHQLHEVQPGVWAVDVALPPGVYNYVFVVDGKAWRLDPLAPRVTDGFGGSSSRVSVLAPQVRS